MILAKVKGTVVCSNKVDKLVGSKLLVIEEWNVITGKGNGQLKVAVDLIGAGAGELILCGSGFNVLQSEGKDNRPIDMSIIGIVDQTEVDGVLYYRKYTSETCVEDAAKEGEKN